MSAIPEENQVFLPARVTDARERLVGRCYRFQLSKLRVKPLQIDCQEAIKPFVTVDATHAFNDNRCAAAPVSSCRERASRAGRKSQAIHLTA